MDVSPELVRAAQRGDQQALEELIQRSYRPAFALARRLLGNAEDAAEATQEAYVRVVRSLPAFREVGAFSTWLFRIVSNVCFSEMRKRRWKEVPTGDMPEGPDPLTDTEEQALDKVFKQEVDRCLDRLPAGYRAVIVLRDIYGLSGDETAKALGTTEGAVKVRLHRARKRLRDEMQLVFPDWGGASEEASA